MRMHTTLLRTHAAMLMAGALCSTVYFLSTSILLTAIVSIVVLVACICYFGLYQVRTVAAMQRLDAFVRKLGDETKLPSFQRTGVIEIDETAQKHPTVASRHRDLFQRVCIRH